MYSTFALMVAFSISAPALKIPESKAESIVGEWEVVEMSISGEPLELLTDAQKIIVQFESDHTMIATTGKSDSVKSTYKVDLTKTPFELDLRVVGAPLQDSSLGIFKFEGDRLIMASGFPGEPRPIGFTSVPGQKTPNILYHLERRKEK